MSQPRTETIEITRGDDFGAEVTFDQDVADFASMRFTLRETWAKDEPDNTSAILTVALTATGARTASLELTSEDTLLLQRDQYVHDIQIVTVAGAKKYTTQRGPVFITPDVSR